MHDLIIGAVVEALAPADRAPHPDRAAVSRITEAASIVPARWRPFADCIVARESHGNPHARNPRSSAQGIAQWLDRFWRHGLAHEIAVRLHEHGMTWADARLTRDSLRRSEIATWPERLQWVGLAAVLDAGNWRPWANGDRCDALAVAR